MKQGHASATGVSLARLLAGASPAASSITPVPAPQQLRARAGRRSPAARFVFRARFGWSFNRLAVLRIALSQTLVG